MQTRERFRRFALPMAIVLPLLVGVLHSLSHLRGVNGMGQSVHFTYRHVVLLFSVRGEFAILYQRRTDAPLAIGSLNGMTWMPPSGRQSYAANNVTPSGWSIRCSYVVLDGLACLPLLLIMWSRRHRARSARGFEVDSRDGSA